MKLRKFSTLNNHINAKHIQKVTYLNDSHKNCITIHCVRNFIFHIYVS